MIMYGMQSNPPAGTRDYLTCNSCGRSMEYGVLQQAAQGTVTNGTQLMSIPPCAICQQRLQQQFREFYQPVAVNKTINAKHLQQPLLTGRLFDSGTRLYRIATDMHIEEAHWGGQVRKPR